MLNKKWMTTPVIAMNSKDSLRKAIKAMTENKVHIIPVMDEEKLVGIITDGNLKKAMVASEKLAFFIPCS